MIYGGMATFIGREDYCTLALKSVVNQLDSLFLHKNEGFGLGLTDNGKFRILDQIDEGYVFLLDDSILYPEDYVKKTIQAIDKHQCIVTYHGRKLKGLGRNYYLGHLGWSAYGKVVGNAEIDVCGTGVTAFHTSYFHPKGLSQAPDKKMSDLVFSLEAAKQGKKIMLLEHEQGWIKDLSPELSIHKTELGNKRQTELADEIWKIKN